MRSCQAKLLWILVAVVFVLLIVAAITGGVYLALRQRQSSAAGWQDPIAVIIPDEIAPDFALYPLAGALELETIDAALAGGELETAYSLLVFGLDLSDAQRIGRLLILGRRFTEFETPQRAALAYGQVYDVAILSSRLNDPARADALLAAGKGWAAVGERDSALQAFDQVYVIATESPYIQLAHRRDLLTSIETAYRDLDEPELADRTREQIVRLDREDYRPPGQPVEWPELPLESEPVSSAEVGELEEARRQAAFEVVDLLGGGVQPAPEEIDRLTQALLAEDAAKTGLYAEQLAQTTQSGRRINIHWHRIGWLMLKYQVAMRGLGMSVVPEWESQVREIQAALSTAYEDLRFDYEDFVTALPAASLMEPGNYQVRRQVILAGRLGQYPNYPETQLAGRLRDSVGQLIGAGLVEQLYVDWTQEEWGLNFFLSPADAYRDAN